MKKFRLTLSGMRRRSTELTVPKASSNSSSTVDELGNWLPAPQSAIPAPQSAIPVAELHAAHAKRTLEHTSSHIV